MEKRLFFIIIIALIIILIVATSFWLVFLPAEPLIKKEVIFSVEKGGGLKEIAFNLEKENLIRWAPAFMAYVLVKGIAGGLKSGEYILSPSMNIPQIADKLFRGDVIKERITIIEGWSLRDIGFYFENKGMFRVEEVWQMAMKDFSNDFDFLKDKPENLGLEGYLFPDTYEIRKNEGLENIIKRMLNNFGRRLTPDLREEIKRQNRTIFEIVTMASMIEREVRKKEDKKLVSGILWKRLKIGMPLQVDATIAYILGRENWTFDEMRREIALGRDIDSPYNTYKYRGLPLGPISNPGLERKAANTGIIYPLRKEKLFSAKP
ncbi:MAG: endolytic transglycosylase MltG [Candidatus Nealsonbacteria bacterium]|nr:endolytic transglycosylase MltG [Candidatus Nealsonbacteria bacterium]